MNNHEASVREIVKEYVEKTGANEEEVLSLFDFSPKKGKKQPLVNKDKQMKTWKRLTFLVNRTKNKRIHKKVSNQLINLDLAMFMQE